MRKIILFLIFILAGCNHVYKEYDKNSFPDFTWKYGQAITFTPEIEDTTQSYKVVVGLRHLYGVKIKAIPVTIKSVSPSGKIKANEHVLQVMDDGNNYLSRCAGDICDLETQIDVTTFEEPGTYQYTISHRIQGASVMGIMEVGLIVDRE